MRPGAKDATKPKASPSETLEHIRLIKDDDKLVDAVIGGIPMSTQGEVHRRRRSLEEIKRDAFRAVKFDNFDKIAIVCLIVAFGALFIWLLARNDQPFYSYLTFLVMVTLVLVGILRAVGVFQTSTMLLGGAAGVFVGLFLLTMKSYDKFLDHNEQISRLKDQISILTCSDPACSTLQRYFDFIQKKEFANALSLVSDTWKQHQKETNGQNYYDEFPALFATSISYRNFSFVFKGQNEQTRSYSVSYDVTDEVPKNTLYDKRKQALSSLTPAYNPQELANFIIGNLNTYYVVPADKVSDIAKYIDDNVTIDEAIDPFFISKLVIDIRRNNTADLKSNHATHKTDLIQRHFAHHVTMSQEHDVWKILNFSKSYIANY